MLCELSFNLFQLDRMALAGSLLALTDLALPLPRSLLALRDLALPALLALYQALHTTELLLILALGGERLFHGLFPGLPCHGLFPSHLCHCLFPGPPCHALFPSHLCHGLFPGLYPALGFLSCGLFQAPLVPTESLDLLLWYIFVYMHTGFLNLKKAAEFV